MSFLNPYLLFGSLALAIPILIHLVRREKSEIIPFSSLMFLLKVPKRSIRQQKMKNLLLMMLRLLILALLVGALPQDDAAEMLELFGLRDAGSTGHSGEEPGPQRLPERAGAAAT